MMLNPRLGQRVQVWYKCRSMPLHGKVGTVTVACRGTPRKCRVMIFGKLRGGPRNHGVTIDGQLYVVPCGNLRKA